MPDAKVPRHQLSSREVWCQHTNMSKSQENLLFVIQKLCFHGAKATEISIFWHPETMEIGISGLQTAKDPTFQNPAPRLQLSSQAGAQRPEAKVPRHQPSSQAGAKISRFLRARGHLAPLVGFPWSGSNHKTDYVGTRVPK